MANHGQVHSIKIAFDPFRLWFPHLLPLRDLFCGPTTIPIVPSSTVFTHFSPQSTLTTCYPSYAAPFFILPISNPSWVTPADFVTQAPSVICNTSPTTNTHCCFYKGHQPTIFIKGNSLILFNLSAPSDSNDCLSFWDSLLWYLVAEIFSYVSNSSFSLSSLSSHPSKIDTGYFLRFCFQTSLYSTLVISYSSLHLPCQSDMDQWLLNLPFSTTVVEYLWIPPLQIV